MQYREIAWAEMKPDVYGGENCDEHIPGWSTYFDGDKEGEDFLKTLGLKAKHFPPGTKVVISVPCCPKCEETCEMCDCGFDWHEWADIEYS